MTRIRLGHRPRTYAGIGLLIGAVACLPTETETETGTEDAGTQELPPPTHCELVEFADGNLANAVRFFAGIHAGSPICAEEVAGLWNLSIFGSEFGPIASLSGLGHLTGLAHLALIDVGGPLDLTPIQALEHLELLAIAGTPVVSFEPLRGSTSIVHLTLANEQLVDIGFLAEMPALKQLYLRENAISDLTPLAGAAALWHLQLTSNAIEDLGPLVSLANLLYLEVGDNQIADIAPLASLTGLVSLDLHGNQIADITALAGLSGLVRLDLGNNAIVDVGPIACLEQVGSLRLSNNAIADLGPLSGMTWAEDACLEMQLDGNPLAESSLTTVLAGLCSEDPPAASWITWTGGSCGAQCRPDNLL